MERIEIDGVPVLWAQGPGPLQAALMFGCGTRDEEFRTIGITHLVEHLACSRLPRLHHEFNGTVDLDTTCFSASGRPEQVVRFLDLICEALGDLPVHRLTAEAGVLAAENGFAAHPTAAGLLTRRFGVRGHGLESFSGPGFDRLDAAAVLAHAARFFVTGNAVLVLSGPPPTDLRLPLPHGPRPRHTPHPPIATQGPRWSTEMVPTSGLALLGARPDLHFSIGMSVLIERVTAIARTERGLSYDIDGTMVDLDNGTADRLVWADAREGHDAEVATILWDTAVRLATEGPTGAEIAEEAEGLLQSMADADPAEDRLLQAAEAELFGRPVIDRQKVKEDLDAGVTPVDVATRFRAALQTALLVVPPQVELQLTDPDGRPVAEGGCHRIECLPAGSLFRPPLLTRAINRDARKFRLALTADSVAMTWPDDTVHEVRFADVVGVQIAGERSRVVFGRNGCVLPIDLDMFPEASSVLLALDQFVPAKLHYTRSAFDTEQQAD